MHASLWWLMKRLALLINFLWFVTPFAIKSSSEVTYSHWINLWAIRSLGTIKSVTFSMRMLTLAKRDCASPRNLNIGYNKGQYCLTFSQWKTYNSSTAREGSWGTYRGGKLREVCDFIVLHSYLILQILISIMFTSGLMLQSEDPGASILKIFLESCYVILLLL